MNASKHAHKSKKKSIMDKKKSERRESNITLCGPFRDKLWVKKKKDYLSPIVNDSISLLIFNNDLMDETGNSKD